MHELAVTEGILTIALEATRKNGAIPIKAIDLVIGDLSSLVDDSLQFYFNILSRGTLAEGAALHFRREPALATCRQCGHIFQVQAPLALACSCCGSILIQVAGGQEFYVESIEIADEDTDC